jgi:hypothetical protein
VALGGLYGLIFALLGAPRAASPGAGLLWGLGYALLLWLARPAGLFPLLGDTHAMGMLDTARAHFPELIADQVRRVRPDGSDWQTYATGVRNPFGLTVGPDGTLWATDNGREDLPPGLPPEELNRIVAGGNYGWPRCYGDRVPDPLGGGNATNCAATIPPRRSRPIGRRSAWPSTRAVDSPRTITARCSSAWPARGIARRIAGVGSCVCAYGTRHLRRRPTGRVAGGVRSAC